LNLQKTPDSLGNSDSASQIASQKIGAAFDGLDSVVEAWATRRPTDGAAAKGFGLQVLMPKA
jgi:hypothetical protein